MHAQNPDEPSCIPAALKGSTHTHTHTFLYRLSFRSPQGASVHILCWQASTPPLRVVFIFSDGECVRQLADTQIVLFEPLYLAPRLRDFSSDRELDALPTIIAKLLGWWKTSRFSLWTCERPPESVFPFLFLFRLVSAKGFFRFPNWHGNERQEELWKQPQSSLLSWAIAAFF